MTITVDTQRVVKKSKNFWSNIHFHPTDAIEDDWGQKILDEIAKDKVAKSVRMYAMLEDIVTEDNEGELHYDFTLTDTRLDYMLSRGFNIFLSYNFIPPCISTDTEQTSTVCKRKTRYKGKYILTAKPKSYEKWEEICRKYTEHIVERYGIDEVSKWHLQCYNEPDVGAFFMREATVSERCEEYCKLYAAFVRGALSVSDRLSVGGPALAAHYNFLAGFLDFVRKNSLRLDFICFHSYGTDPHLINNGSGRLCVENHLKKIYDVMLMAKERGFSHIPLIIDEWGATTGGFLNIEDCPALIFRETPAFAAYFVKLFIMLNSLNLPIEKLMICLSGQHEMQTDFSGFRNFFTLNFYKKPIYNAYVLAAKLFENELYFENSEECKELSIYPTASDDGRVSVILAYASENFEEGEPIEVELKFVGTGSSTATLTAIDSTHANAISAYRALGCPDSPTESEKTSIATAATLRSERVDVNNSTVKIKIEQSSVILVEL
ncbi:MAG: hypothetical protein IKA74_03035 [Clostridia bacterium]|nr:hypothetical protein [Clostridia bacterium]